MPYSLQSFLSPAAPHVSVRQTELELGVCITEGRTGAPSHGAAGRQSGALASCLPTLPAVLGALARGTQHAKVKWVLDQGLQVPTTWDRNPAPSFPVCDPVKFSLFLGLFPPSCKRKDI